MVAFRTAVRTVRTNTYLPKGGMFASEQKDCAPGARRAAIAEPLKDWCVIRKVTKFTTKSHRRGKTQSRHWEFAAIPNSKLSAQTPVSPKAT